ncbi:hypothetical protein A5821_003256 [Enterococcus sp. 7F3_DIV0205]|uniref:Uncharacterized protein n=1 Tax=Candidatus Enterococcus palustris TaxID=1834189 RepID=A0AAQ3WB76_9ENTE|nr:hypothetical protein [Enterococcus sp. 7F3_DIV0205]OTN84138.1 hypothetical protein A5821_000064 [Enterococcus sp. 7F3_DIV0205]
MNKKAVLVLGGIIILCLVIGGEGYMDKKELDQKIEENISKAFSERYLDPEDKEIEEITFYRAPTNQSDATENRNYFFYINNNSKWKVGASVKIKQKEIWAFGSDNIELNLKEEAKKVEKLKVNYYK